MTAIIHSKQKLKRSSFQQMTEPLDYPRITAIVCALNEADNLPHVLPKIPSFVDEILLIDGHSTDHTVEVAKKLCPEIRILQQPGQGKGEAMKFGVRHATGDIIVTLDADGSNDPEILINFVHPLANGADFVKGSRFLGNRPMQMPLRRRFGNWLLVAIANKLHGTDFTDLCCGYNAFRNDFLDRIILRDGEFDYEPALILKAKKAGLRIAEVPCLDMGRINGTSKLSDFPQGWKALHTIIKERFCE